MRVEAIELRQLRLPFTEAMRASYGSHSEKVCILATVYTDGGHGYGECSAFADPFYTEESVDTAWLVMNRYLAPALLGTNMSDPASVSTLFSQVRGHYMAKAGLEAAVWDAYAKTRGCSLASLVGGAKKEVETGISLGLYETQEALLQRVFAALDAGYVRIKVKIAPGQDISVLSAIRSTFGDISLSADANGAYKLADLPHLRELDTFGLQMIEQPLAFDDLLDHARLAQHLDTPICLDESIRSVKDGETAIALGACRVMCIKYGRVGGLTEARSLLKTCAQNGIGAWCGGMYETGVGRLATIALASHDAITLPGDISPSSRYFDEDIIDPPVTFSRPGRIAVPEGLGLGTTLRVDVVEQCTVLRTYYAV